MEGAGKWPEWFPGVARGARAGARVFSAARKLKKDKARTGMASPAHPGTFRNRAGGSRGFPFRSAAAGGPGAGSGASEDSGFRDRDPAGRAHSGRAGGRRGRGRGQHGGDLWGPSGPSYIGWPGMLFQKGPSPQGLKSDAHGRNPPQGREMARREQRRTEGRQNRNGENNSRWPPTRAAQGPNRQPNRISRRSGLGGRKPPAAVRTPQRGDGSRAGQHSIILHAAGLDFLSFNLRTKKSHCGQGCLARAEARVDSDMTQDLVGTFRSHHPIG